MHFNNAKGVSNPMPINTDGNLTVFSLNVGQADTTVIVTPEGGVVIIDATRPDKLVDLLEKLGLQPNETISALIISHPHVDHFRGANRLLNEYRIESVTLAPFWNMYGMGPASYRTMVNRIEEAGMPVDFVSGYSRLYPDGVLRPVGASGSEVDPDAPYLELLGPSNNLIGQLESARKLDTNHLSIMTRLTWRKFRMIIAADAQMENWAHFDREGMLEGCSVLRSSHHGSCNGTQWERLARLGPKAVIVSSDPASGHHLPDLIGTAIFAKYSVDRQIVALTSETGSVRITVQSGGGYQLDRFGDGPDAYVKLTDSQRLTWQSNPTDWEAMLSSGVDALYE